MSNGQRPHLSSDQVYELNEKHGWFQFGDAQSDVSCAFAQDAIEMYERIRAAAPELLEALELAVNNFGEDDGEDDWTNMARAAIAKARNA